MSQTFWRWERGMERLMVSNAALSSILKEDAEVTGIEGEEQVIGNFELFQCDDGNRNWTPKIQ